MTTAKKTKITVEATINAPVEKVWKLWTDPGHIVKWNNASDDWHTPKAENDLRVGGKFSSRMEAKDGSMGFDFSGEYQVVDIHKRIEYFMEDGREVTIKFTSKGNETTVTESFDAETINSLEMQKAGWQAILGNFKNYTEAFGKLEKMYFEINIEASPEKVYKTMLDDKHYREWTSEFHPGSYYEGTWEKGSKILFLGPDDKGNVGGMVSRIKENIPNEFVSIEHMGVVHNEKETTSGPEVEGWAGAFENYTFTKNNGNTLVSVDTDINQEYKDMFLEMWPKALNKLKSICERK